MHSVDTAHCRRYIQLPLYFGFITALFGQGQGGGFGVTLWCKGTPPPPHQVWEGRSVGEDSLATFMPSRILHGVTPQKTLHSSGLIHNPEITTTPHPLSRRSSQSQCRLVLSQQPAAPITAGDKTTHPIWVIDVSSLQTVPKGIHPTPPHARAFTEPKRRRGRQ